MIEVKHLTKRYGSHTAVSDLSFTVEKGQIYGFLGPNGAGKSTTMNIMTGCLAATSGEVVIGGYDIFQDAAQAKRLIGYLPEQPPLYLDRTPKEYLRFVARAKGIPEKNISAELDRVMTVTGTWDVADRLMKNLSKGYRQRVGIAQAVLGDPEVIILDEPTVGLDPRQITEIRELIRQLGKERTVILSSHILSELANLATCYGFLDNGMMLEQISARALDLRGLLTALRLMERGLSPEAALEMGIINKAFDPFERQLTADVVWARVPRTAKADEFFGD